MIDISCAHKIDGWMLDQELMWLAEQARHHRMIAEIGSWKGRSTRALADHTEGVVFAVDTWSGSNEEAHRKEFEGRNPWWLSDEFKENLSDHLVSGKVIMIWQPSLVTARSIVSSLKFDMIFIDAEHTYQAVKADIAAWCKFLTPGGLLCGHDYGGPWVQVTRAVDEAFPTRKHHANTSIWYIKPG